MFKTPFFDFLSLKEIPRAFFKGSAVSEPYFMSLTRSEASRDKLARTKMKNTDQQKTVELALCLQPPAETDAVWDFPHVWQKTKTGQEQNRAVCVVS